MASAKNLLITPPSRNFNLVYQQYAIHSLSASTNARLFLNWIWNCIQFQTFQWAQIYVEIFIQYAVFVFVFVCCCDCEPIIARAKYYNKLYEYDMI